MLNSLTNEDRLLIKDPLSSKKRSAIDRRLLLREKEKSFFMRNVHRVIDKWGRWILENRLQDYKDEIVACEKKFNSKFRGYKIFILWTVLRRKKPQVVVEYGSGSSTFLIAAILDKNRSDFGVNGSLFSFEQNPSYYDLVSENLPDRLSRRVSLVQSTVGYE